MKPDTKTTRTLAAIGTATTYVQLQAATGYDEKFLMNCVAGLKRRGYVARVNEGAPRCEIAVIRITAKGLDLLQPEPKASEPVETTVQRAVRVRSPLATVWNPA